MSDTNEVETVVAEVPNNDKKKKISPLVMIIPAAIILVALIVVIISSLLAPKPGFTYRVAERGYIDYDDYGYIPDDKGGIIPIAGDVSKMYSTVDGKHVIYIDNSGKLFTSNGSGKNSIEVDRDVTSINVIRNNTIVYQADGKYYRYSIGNKDKVKIGNIDDFVVTSSKYKEINMAFENNGKIYLFPSNKKEPVKLAKSKDLRLVYLTNDGKKVVWVDAEKKKKVLHITSEKEDLEVLDSNNYISVRPYDNGNKFLVFDGDDRIYNISIDGKVLFESKIKEGTPDFNLDICTSDGRLNVESSSDSFYFVSRDGSEKTLCYIDSKGNSSKVIDDFSYYGILDGNLYYIDGSNLKMGKLNGAKLKTQEKLYKNIMSFYIHEESGYLFMTNEDKEFLCAKSGKDPVVLSNSIETYYVGEDKQSVYFFENGDRLCGTLMLYKPGFKEPEKISDDVDLSSLYCPFYNYAVPNFGLYFLRVNDVNDYSLMFYKNGKTIEVKDGF